MVQNLGTRNTRKVEITMVSQIDHCRFVGCGLIMDIDSVIVCKDVNHLHIQVAWETSLTILGQVCKLKGLVVDLLSVPNNSMITFWTTMQAVAIVVLRQLILITIKLELAIGDTVAVSTDQSTIIHVWISHILIDVIIAQHHVCHLSILIWNHHRHKTSAPIGNTSLSSTTIPQHIKSGLLPINLRLKS
ncbi:hypothetical protein EVA_15791 [gut metagenome]|uniref:Uncharacterized protein n=1 Tax=gut metagenome TaxID=749906 RepID=J9G2T4_9ZZZZ